MTTMEVLAQATKTAESTFDVTKEQAFDMALAVMISQDPTTMRVFLESAQSAFEAEK